MKLDKMIAVGTDRSEGKYVAGFLALVAVATLVLAPPVAQAASSGGSGSGDKNHAVSFESISGSTIKRVILTPKAAERLGIETAKVDVQSIVRKQMVGGVFVRHLENAPVRKATNSRFDGFGRVAATLTPKPPPAAKSPPVKGDGWVRVALSRGEWERLAKSEPARVFPLTTRGESAKEVSVRPSNMMPFEDRKRSMLTIYYVVVGKDHGLKLNQRVRIELQLSGDGEKRKVVPYGAVYYDANGVAWTYVNLRPLVFERQRITVERVVGDLAVLSDGPSVGTPVVTVGAALLYGAEVVFKR